jgi:DNA-binding GntR family transcriptional regulator
MPLVTTKADAAYVEIHRRIIEGELAPGAVLDQGALARDLGISTTPVREALRRLEMEQLVEMSAHREARVVAVSPQDVRYLYEVRMELDPLAAGLAAERATKAEADALARLAGARGRTPLKQSVVNRRFHQGVYHACHNPVLISELDSLWDRTDSYRLALLSASPAEAVLTNHEHAEIAEAIKTRDVARARELTRVHLIDSFARVEHLIEADEARSRSHAHARSRSRSRAGTATPDLSPYFRVCSLRSSGRPWLASSRLCAYIGQVATT